ncbi:MFS transporter [Halorarum salinum]|uniref:MFS transporter n=1 Tax=Halorarum salinum TaxID=2743089 RepID=A0A7D5Q9T9_9EURY|nr:MFS transporter [Halobaculum salinum]QLG60320.1 MFS transporter [Halobaculum salinum]
MTALTLSSIVFISVMGVLVNRFSRRHALAGSLVIAALSGVVTSLALTFEELLSPRVVQGLGYNGVMPMTVTLLGDLLWNP